MELRCKHKVAYKNSAYALAALQLHNANAKEKGQTKLTGYYCCQYCKLWHTTSLPSKHWVAHQEFHRQRVIDDRITDADKSHVGKIKKQKR